jgi:tetratricopeptide (TPR) repeat protein
VIWSDKYDRSQKDLVALQNEIAFDVSSKLRSKLSGADAAKVEKKNTTVSEAYQLYLKGQYEWHKHTQEAVRKGIEYYNQALEKDPNYALAYFGLSASYGVLGNNYISPKEAFPRANAYAEKALAIDPTLSEAHTALAAVKLYYEWDWAAAERELKLAQSLDPSDVESHNVYGDYLDAMGRFDESQSERKRTQELDQLAPMYGINLGTTLYMARKYDEAIAQFDRTITLEPHIGEAYLYRGQAFVQKKMYPQALESFQKGLDQGQRTPSLVAALGQAYALTGDRAKADMALAELAEVSKQMYVSPYYFAVVYLGLEDKKTTFIWLEKAFQEKSGGLIWLNVEPLFDPLRDDLRFKAMLKRMNLPE